MCSVHQGVIKGRLSSCVQKPNSFGDSVEKISPPQNQKWPGPTFLTPRLSFIKYLQRNKIASYILTVEKDAY